MIQLKEIRKATGKTQRSFAEFVGVPLRTLEDWERGLRIPPEYVKKLIVYYVEKELNIKIPENGDF